MTESYIGLSGLKGWMYLCFHLQPFDHGVVDNVCVPSTKPTTFPLTHVSEYLFSVVISDQITSHV